jgi:hypothetical protein
MNNKKNVEIFIKLTSASSSSLINLDKFQNRLSAEYTVINRKKWIPAYSDYTELIIGLLITKGLDEFWNALKIKLKNFWDSLDDIYAANNDNVDLQTLKFEFEDTTIKIHGVKSKPSAFIQETLNRICEEIPVLQQKGFQNISLIEMPIQRRELDGQFDVSDYTSESELENIWLIKYDFGANTQYYDYESHSVVSKS